jgi:hypothetical protein
MVEKVVITIGSSALLHVPNTSHSVHSTKREQDEDIPNLATSSAIIMYNMPYHELQVDKPTKSSLKKEMLEYLLYVKRELRS